MNRCLCCQKSTDSDVRYHAKCLRYLFGKDRAPSITFTKADLPAAVSKIQGKMSISGVQIKASVRLDRKAGQLDIVATAGSHVLKPEPDAYPELPHNENLCMNIAAKLGMSVPPHGLFPMVDGKLCYVVKRFDRLEDGTKLHKETMYQILESEDKYRGSLEQIGKAIRKHAANVGLDCIEFFERALLCYLCGNGDMHLQNWALLQDEDNEWKLAPCYDLVSSKLYLPNEDESALTIRGKKNNLTRNDFKALAENLQIDSMATENSLTKLRDMKDEMLELVRESEMTPEKREKMEVLVQARYMKVFG